MALYPYEGGLEAHLNSQACALRADLRPSSELNHECQSHGFPRIQEAWALTQGHRIESAETAAALYEKKAKKVAPTGWEAFNQKTKAEAYEKRTAKIPVDLQVSSWSLLHRSQGTSM